MINSNNQSIINDQIMPENEYQDFLETFIIYSQKDLPPYKDPNTPNPRHPFIIKRFKKRYINWRWIKRISYNCQKSKYEFPSIRISHNHKSTKTRMENTKKTRTEKTEKYK